MRSLWPGRCIRRRSGVGSGNLLREPNDQYLYVVSDRGASTGGVFLPFEEDGGMLSVVVSKDQTFLRQLSV